MLTDQDGAQTKSSLAEAAYLDLRWRILSSAPAMAGPLSGPQWQPCAMTS